MTHSHKLLEVTENIWVAEDSMRMIPGFHLPLRCTVIRLGTKLLVHSPLKWLASPELAEELAALGQVSWIVAPNLIHHLHVRPLLERFANAELLAPKGLANKRPDLQLSRPLEDGAPAQWQGVVDLHFVAGMPKVDEFVLFHRPSKTLLVVDLVFNIQEPQGALAGLMLRLFGSHKRLAVSRLLASQVQNKDTFAKSLQAIAQTQPQRVIMAHGAILKDNAAQALSAALSKASTSLQA